VTVCEIKIFCRRKWNLSEKSDRMLNILLITLESFISLSKDIEYGNALTKLDAG
jgi:hypothetical protein